MQTWTWRWSLPSEGSQPMGWIGAFGWTQIVNPTHKMPSSFILHLSCFIFRKICVFWRLGAHTGNMPRIAQFCWLSKTYSSRRTPKWPGAGGRINECRISRSSPTSIEQKIMENYFHGFSAYLLPSCTETKVVKRSHTICYLVASVISYGWFTLQRATGPEPSSENVCSVFCLFRGTGPRKIKVVRGIIWALYLVLLLLFFFNQGTMGFYQGNCWQNFKGRWVCKFRWREGLCIHQILYHQCPSPLKTKTKLWNHQTDNRASFTSHIFFCTAEVGGSFMPPGDYAILLHITGMIVHTQGRGNKGKRETQRGGWYNWRLLFRRGRRGNSKRTIVERTKFHYLMTLGGLLKNRIFCSTWLSSVRFTFANDLRPLWTQTCDVKDRVEVKVRVIFGEGLLINYWPWWGHKRETTLFHVSLNSMWGKDTDNQEWCGRAVRKVDTEDSRKHREGHFTGLRWFRRAADRWQHWSRVWKKEEWIKGTEFWGKKDKKDCMIKGQGVRETARSGSKTTAVESSCSMRMRQ